MDDVKAGGDGSLEIPVDVKGLTQAQMNELAQKSIFRPVQEQSWLKTKYRAWLIKQLTTETSPLKPRFQLVHVLLKKRIVEPGLRLVCWLLRKHLVKKDSDIPHEWYNNHHRIFRHSFYKANEDMWRYMVFEQHRRTCLAKGEKCVYADGDVYLKFQVSRNAESYEFRNMIIDIWLTEIMEDTADREWLNFAMLRMCREMMELYGVDEKELAKLPMVGEYPIYLGSQSNYPPYFINNRRMPVWLRREKEVQEVL